MPFPSTATSSARSPACLTVPSPSPLSPHHPPGRDARQARPDAEALAAAVPEFDIGALAEEHQQLYDGLVRMLCLLSNADSRALLEQAYRPGPRFAVRKAHQPSKTG